MPGLSNKAFLNELSDYLMSPEAIFTINLTQKRFLPKGSFASDELSSNVVDHPPNFGKNTDEYHVLVRAKYGDDTSLTTAVSPDDLSDFWSEYSQVIKSGLKQKNKNQK